MTAVVCTHSRTQFCLCSEKDPGKLQKAANALKNACFGLVTRQESDSETQRRDELAEPLLEEEEQRDEEEQQGNGRLEDIQEVDLEAGQGQGPSQQGRSGQPSRLNGSTSADR